MRILFAGTPTVALPSLAALHNSNHEVVACLTRPPAPVGRSQRAVPSPVAVWAAAAGVPVLCPASAREESLVQQLTELRVQAAAVVAYGNLLPPPLLAALPFGWVNLHFSLLPAYRGAAPVPAAIRAGEEITGATTFLLDKGMDTGPVIGYLTETLRPRDTTGEVLDRLASAGADLLVASIDALGAGTARPTAQTGEVSFAPRIAAADTRIDWALPAIAVDRTIRAYTPLGAWTVLDGTRMVLGPVLPTNEEHLTPGRILVRKHEVLVGTATNPVRLGQVKPAGKRFMSAADWARGSHCHEESFV